MKKNELTITDRLLTPSPSLFQKIQKTGVFIAAVAAGLVVFRDNLATNGVFIPALFAHIIEIVGYVSAAIAAVSTLPVDDNRRNEPSGLGSLFSRVMEWALKA